jgi:undecaprenyl-diphosphatase
MQEIKANALHAKIRKQLLDALPTMTALIQPLDSAVLQALFSARVEALTGAMLATSTWGDWRVLIPLAMLCAIGFGISGRAKVARGMLVSVFGAGLTVVVLKALVARPRPPIAFWATTEPWYSFPSAHASLSAAFFGFIALLLIRARPYPSRKLDIALALTMPLIIGFNRLYLGVHYLSDVLAGLCLGALFVFVGRFAMRSRGKLSV